MYPASWRPALDDDRRSAGLCGEHGDYNGRLLSCPYCKAEKQYHDEINLWGTIERDLQKEKHMKQELTKKTRKQAKRLVRKTKRTEYAITPEFVASLPKGDTNVQANAGR